MASSRSSAADIGRTLAAALGDEGLWLVAYSGGLDSSVLLHAASRAVDPSRLIAIHVHHGLQPIGDQWPGHCAEQARGIGVRFDCVSLVGAPAGEDGLEAWAREHRYRALAQACAGHHALGVLTAHHADDQVETMLMRLARGTGLDGITGIEPDTMLHGVRVMRPLLACSRDQLKRYAREHGLQWVEDPSNRDIARTRNRIRHLLLPRLETQMPELRRQMLAMLPALREARDAQSALAGIDLTAARFEGGIHQSVLLGLPPAQRDAALRAWLRELGVRMPTRARLQQIRAQLVDGQAVHGEVLHEGWLLIRDRQSIRAIPAASPARKPVPEQVLHWQGQARLALAAGHGTLVFEQAGEGDDCGVSVRWLTGRRLEVGPGGAGSMRLRPNAGGPSRSLKNLYQERQVPAWMRAGLPVVRVGDRLLFAAGVGMDRDRAWPCDGQRVRLRWEPDRPDDPRYPYLNRRLVSQPGQVDSSARRADTNASGWSIIT